MSVGALPKQLGCMLLQDGVIAKSEGDLVNAERLASVVLRMVAVGSFFASPFAVSNEQIPSTNGDENNGAFCSPPQFDRLTILFPDHQYDIVVGGGATAVTGGKQSQQQKQVIHVVKRVLSSSD